MILRHRVRALGHLTAAVLLLVLSTDAFAQGPVAHWPFSGNANDVSGNGHHGMVSGATLVPDRFGNANSAYSFNGGTDQILVPGHSDFRIASGQELTVVAWIKLCTLQRVTRTTNWYGFPQIVGTMRVTTTTDEGWGLFIYNNPFATDTKVNRLEFLFWDPTGRPFNLWDWNDVAIVAVDDGLWHQVAYVSERGFWDATASRWRMTHSLYADGTLIDRQSAGTDQEHNGVNDQTPLTIGRDQTAGIAFIGAIDDVRIYHRALSEAELGTLRNANGWSGGGGAVSITPSTTQRICEGSEVRLAANGTGSIAQYRWTPAYGLSDPTSPNPIARPAVTTTYRLEAFSGQPCAARLAAGSITIEVDPAPRTGVNGQTRYICIGETITMGAPADGGLAPYRYSWTPTTGLSNPTDIRPTLRVTRTERYVVAVTDARGCVGRDTIMITALAPPAAEAGPDTLYCGGAGIILGRVDSLNGGTPPRKYRWSPAAGLDDSTLAQPTARPSKTTRYYLEITDALGCRSGDSVLMRVGEPARALVGRDTAICVGGTADLGAPPISGYLYEWSPATGLSNPRIANPNARPGATTTYRLLARTSAGCEAIDSVTVTVLDPVLEVDMTELDFGTLDGCTSSKEMSLRVSNTGTSELTITTATFLTQDFVAVTSMPLDVAAGAARDLVIRYAPGAAGASLDTLVLAGMPCDVTAGIVLRGARERSLMSTSVAAIDFGRSVACALPDTTAELTLRNDGDATARIEAPLLAAPFTMEPANALPANLAAGGTITILVRYRPTAAGVHAGEVRFPFASGTCRDTLRVRLNGIVDDAALRAPVSLDFGALDGCESTRDTAIVVRATGTAELRVTQATVPTGYRLLSTIPMTIAAGDSAVIALRYEPAGNGVHAGDLVLAAEPCALEHRIALTGSRSGVTVTLADDVDFGVVTDCDAASMVRAMTLAASGGVATVSTVGITGPFATTLVSGVTISDGGAASFDVSVLAGMDGAVTGELVITLEPCGIGRRVALRAARTTTAIISGDLDFGTQSTGSLTARDITVTNTGSSPARIDSLSTINPPFTITGTTPGVPATLAPGASLTVHVEYRAVAGVSIDTLVAVAGVPCETLLVMELRGVGAAGAVATVSLPGITAAAGDRVSIPLILSQPSGLDAAGAVAFEAVIAFDRSLLVPVAAGASTSDATTRRMTVRGMRGVGDTLASLAMIATLGRASSTPLVIESFRWTDASEEVGTTLTNGSLTIDGICAAGGTRLFDGSGEVLLKPAAPNPASGVAAIEYSLAEPGRTRLDLHDASGAHVATLIDGGQEAGAYVQWVDVSGLPAGAYVIVLQTPTLVLSERMVVRR